MQRRVSESVTGQNQPKPTRSQRDDAYSADGGRKAVEVPMPEQPDEVANSDADTPEEKTEQRGETLSPCVGTELETQGQDLKDR